MELTMLGTGNALVTECYNTCFVLQEDQKYLDVYKRQVQVNGWRDLNEKGWHNL